MSARAARCGNDPRGDVAVEVEYAVRLEDGRIWPRPSEDAAEESIHGIVSRGGIAVLVTRQVTRTGWAEPDEDNEEREFDLGAAPDYKCFTEDHAACQEHGYVCTCACHKPKEASR